jgi:hypothetical protein
MGFWEILFVAVGTTLFALVFIAMGWSWGVRYSSKRRDDGR